MSVCSNVLFVNFEYISLVLLVFLVSVVFHCILNSYPVGKCLFIVNRCAEYFLNTKYLKLEKLLVVNQKCLPSNSSVKFPKIQDKTPAKECHCCRPTGSTAKRDSLAGVFLGILLKEFRITFWRTTAAFYLTSYFQTIPVLNLCILLILKIYPRMNKVYDFEFFIYRISKTNYTSCH